MQSTDMLKQEHAIIADALTVLSHLAGFAMRGVPVPREPIETLLRFFREFVDGIHHAKEERALFPALEARGVPHHQGPIGMMLFEHDEGRAFVAQMAEAAPAIMTEPAARARFAEAARCLITLLGSHIQKENMVLFRMADRVLSAADDAQVRAAFAEHDREALGEEGSSRHRDVVARLKAEFCPPSMAPARHATPRRTRPNEPG